MKFYTKRCSQNTLQKLPQVGGSSLYFSRFLSFTRNFLFLLPLVSLFLFASCGGGGGGGGGSGTAGDSGGSAADNLSIANSSVAEDDRSINFIVSLPAVADSATSFYYRTKEDSAKAGSDYSTTNASASIALGDIATTISVVIINDDEIEDEESFFVEILRSSTADTVIATAIATIKIDDLPSLSITGASASEDARSLEFIARLSAPFPGNDVSFSYETVAGSATEGDDYTGVATNTATIIASSTQISIPISIVKDSKDEGTEVFELVISNPVNATISQASALGTIKGEIASLFIADATALESERQMKFIVSLSEVFSRAAVSFNYKTIAGSASDGIDYTGVATRSVTIPTGDTAAEIFIDLSDDSLVEDDETFDLVIFSLVNATTGDIRATGTIKVEDVPILSITDVIALETTSSVKFTATLSEAFLRTDVFFNYRTLGSSATEGDDYEGVTTQKASILAGDTTTEIFITIIDDDLVEDDESFDVRFSRPVNATLGNTSATATIISDDLPRLYIADATAREGEDMQFSVTLDATFSQDISFSYYTLAGSALAGADYTEVTANSITTASIPAGSTSVSIVIPIVADAVAEGDESFFLMLTDPLNATLARSRATGTIKGLATIHITGGSALEDDQELRFVARLERPLAKKVSFSYYTLAGSALAGVDYTEVTAANPLSISIPTGDTATEFSIIIIDDGNMEFDETFDVRFINPVNAVLGQQQVTATIIDTQPSLSIADAIAQEDAGVIEFIVTLSVPSLSSVSFDYATQSISANVLKFTSFTNNQGSVLWGAYEHTSVVFKNFMWSLGGSNSSSSRGFTNTNHAWRLTSGRDFDVRSRIKEARNSHSSLVFEEKMWVLGGNTASRIYASDAYQNDVQYSTGGVEPWNKVKPNNNAGWQARRSHSSVVFKNKMWVLGGYSKKYLPTDASLRNDVWDSTNGIAWNEVKADSTNDPHSWSARQEHTSVVFDNKMWVLGGSVSGDYNQNDVWDSTNGIAWNEVKTNNNADWEARYKHTSVVYEGKIWVLGGDSGKYPARDIKQDAWYSIDGVVWNKNTENLYYRAGHTSVVFEDRLWLIGGINTGGFLRLAYFEAQKDYISQSARVSILLGATSKTLTINLINDNVREDSETFRLIISNPTNAVIDSAHSKATGTIQDND